MFYNREPQILRFSDQGKEFQRHKNRIGSEKNDYWTMQLKRVWAFIYNLENIKSQHINNYQGGQLGI